MGKGRNGLGSGERVEPNEEGTGVISRVAKPVLRVCNPCSISTLLQRGEGNQSQGYRVRM